MIRWLENARRYFERLERRYRGHPLNGFFFSARFLLSVLLEFYRDHCFMMATGLTLTSLLSLVPVMTILFSVWSRFASFQKLQQRALKFLYTTFIPEPSVRDQVSTYLQEFTQASGNVTIISVLALFVTAISLFLTVEFALNVIWAVRRHRPFIESLMRFVTTLVAGPLLLGLSLWLSAFVSAERRVQELFTYKAVGFAFTVCVSWLLFFLAYLLIPYRRVRLRPALAGSFVAAFLWELAKQAFVMYVGRTRFYTSVYGNLSTIPIFLLWVYLTWLITLLGAEISYCLQNRLFLALSDRFDDSPQLRGQLAAVAMVELGKRFFVGQGCTSVEDLAERYRISPDVFRDILYILEDGKLVMETQSGDTGSYMPARSLERITLADIVRVLNPGDLFDRLEERRSPLRHLQYLFGEAEQSTDAVLAAVTLEDAVKRQIEAEDAEDSTEKGPADEKAQMTSLPSKDEEDDDRAKGSAGEE